ncbi:MAG TPA: trigger factor [Blastocatellia bacterium]|nr:trigger factor [Blastocatellia bacterium]
MNITVTDEKHCKKKLRLEIPADTVRTETDKMAAKLARQVNVPGFRRGKVPSSVVKTRFRKELRDEVLSHLLPHSLGDAIREKELKVIGEPAVDDLKFGDDESIDVTFTVEVAPEFDLSNYQRLPLTKRVYGVRDEDVERTLDRLREGQAELVPVEDRGSQQGDLLTVNLNGDVEPESEAAEAGEKGATPSKQDLTIKKQDTEIELGGKGVLSEFTDALIGTRPGDIRSFAVTYPGDYKPESYAGRKVNYTAEVTAVGFKELPDADDEFAQGIGEQFKTIEELRADIRSKLEHEGERRSDAELRSSLMEQLVDRNRFEVPDYIVEKQMDSRLNTFLRQLAGQGLDPRNLKVDWDDFRESQRERAEREVRGSFILDRIAEAEKIEVADTELDAEISQLAERSGAAADVLRARLTKEGSLDSIKEQVRNRKALDLVIASADTRIEEVEGIGGEDVTAGAGQRAKEQGDS